MTDVHTVHLLYEMPIFLPYVYVTYDYIICIIQISWKD